MSDLTVRIERAYREAVAELPYTRVTVKLLCERTGITRKSFYKRFGGKADVLRYVFDRDVVRPHVDLCRLLTFEKMRDFASQMERHEFKAIAADARFYGSVVLAQGGGEDEFASVASGVFADFNLMILREFAFDGTDEQAEYVAMFFAEAKARFMARWIREGYRLSAEEAGDLYSRMALPFWSGLAG